MMVSKLEASDSAKPAFGAVWLHNDRSSPEAVFENHVAQLWRQAQKQ
jgi:hypothetical protein